MSAFYSQFPGNWKFRTRLANVSSLNFLGLSPLHNFATGKGKIILGVSASQHCKPQTDSLTTSISTRLIPPENSVGEKVIANTMVIGKSGTGKTALINFLLSQVQRLDPSPTIFFFDKDRGAEIFVRACGGNYLSLEVGRPTGFNPFHCERNEENVQFLVDLVKVLAAKSSYSAREEGDIYQAIENILDTPVSLRSMANFQKSLPNMGDDGLYARLRKWTAGNSLGWVFDNPIDSVDLQKARIIGFDYTEVLDNPEVRVPVISYLLHRLESLIDGRPLIYVMDEFWKILEGGGGLKDFAKNKQKTIRKQNGLGIFATQSPEDALSSDISAALVEQTATLILLPNPSAKREDYVDGLKLTDAEYQVVKGLDERSRCFLVKQGHAATVCQLNLRGLDDCLAVISASTDNIEIMHTVVAEAARRAGVDPNDVPPEQWLGTFYAKRLGSRSGRQESVPM
jgi:type IV secretion system protein VirB4